MHKPIIDPKMKSRNNKRRAARKPQVNLSSKAAIIVCTVCGKGDGKYKCPKCRAPFCCVQCSKDHKATLCCPVISGVSSSSSAATTTVTVINSNSNNNSASITSPSVEPSAYLSKNCILSTITTNHLHPHKRLRRSNNDDDDEYDSHDDEPGWNITNEMKARLQQSSWLRKELQDGGLRQLIDNIDAASDSMNDEEHVNQQSRERSHWNNQGRKKNMNSKNATRISARELALARTKHTHPKFASFTDQLLLLAGVLQPAAGGGGGEVTMSDTGLIDEGDNHGQLVLAPIPRLNRTVLKSSGSGTEEGEEVVDDDDGSNNSSSDEESEDSSSSSSSSSEEKGDGDESNDSTEE